jgi:hypothetical protein
MLRRRPAAVYELLAEDELLAGADEASEPDRQPHDDGLRGCGRDPVSVAATSTLGAPYATARRTLLVALTAAALVGFAVWELLGIASESVASRPGAAIQAPRADLAQPQLGRRRSRAPGRATRPLHAGRAAANAMRTPPATPAAHVALGSPAAPQPGRPPMPAAPIVPALSPSTPSAEQEFGFER